MSETSKTNQHRLTLENRARLCLSGVEDVSGFNEEAISVKTCDGNLLIKGSGLHIDRLDLESGEVSVDGRISSLQYSGGENRQSRFSRLFR